jgi:type II secretory pathway pseudopilin PulG
MIAMVPMNAGNITAIVVVGLAGLAALVALVAELTKSRRASSERARLGLYAARQQLEVTRFRASVREDARRLSRELLNELRDSGVGHASRAGYQDGRRGRR